MQVIFPRMHVQRDILYSQWKGKSALMLAAQSGHSETVKELLDGGANVNVNSNVLYSLV